MSKIDMIVTVLHAYTLHCIVHRIYLYEGRVENFKVSPKSTISLTENDYYQT